METKGATCVVPSEHVSAEYGNASFYTRLGIRYSLFPGECRNSVAQANSKREPRWPNPEFDEREHRARNKLVIIANPILPRPPPTATLSNPANRSLSILASFFRRTIRIG